MDEALKAQKFLREAAGLPPERFPMEAFVGMVSYEVDALRQRGRNDEEIAEMIRQNSAIMITAAEIAENYVPPEQRSPHGH